MAVVRWEYCNVTLGEKQIRYFTPQGIREVRVADSDAAIASLGAEGWELATDHNAYLLFKRPMA